MFVCIFGAFLPIMKNAINLGREQINVVEGAKFNGCVTVKV